MSRETSAHLMTLGPALVVLSVTDACPGLVRQRLVMLGRISLLFLVHGPVLH